MPGPKLVTFQPMLAASEIPIAKQLRFPLLASFKLDGIRAPQTGGFSMSRKMIPLPNKFVQAWSDRYANQLHGLDGELIVGPPNLQTTFNTTTSAVNSIEGEPDFRYYVFEHWNCPGFSAQFRYNSLQLAFKHLPDEVLSRLVLLEQVLIKSLGELKLYYVKALALGYEGLILKAPDEDYKFGRSTINGGQALKWKEFDFIKCRITGVKQGMKNTNEKTRDAVGKAKRSSAKAGKVPVEEVGGFEVVCEDDTSAFNGKQFRCGPGNLKDDELQNLWAIAHLLPGRLIRVKVQKSGAMDLPRFPGFNAWVSENDTGTVCN
jgi:DNA ligase-1